MKNLSSEVEITDGMLRVVWRKIEALRLGEFMIIAAHAPKRPDVFIQCCKMWIDCYKAAEFNRDYSKLYRITPFNEIVKLKEKENIK